MLTKEKLTCFLFIISLIDFLILPRLAIPFYVPITLYVVLTYSFIQRRTISEIIPYLAFTVGVLTSLLYSLTNTNSPIDENIKRAIQLITVFAYYYAFSKNQLYNPRIISLLWLFSLYVMIASILYGFEPRDTAEFFWRLYPESLGSEEEALFYLRFQYIFQDPNSHAYFLSLVLGIILILEKSNFKKILALSLFLPMIMITQSRGGLLAYAALAFLSIIEIDSPYRHKIFYIFLLILVISSVLIYLDFEFQLIELLMNRSNYEEDLGGGRMGKYLYFFSNFNFLPFGIGHHLELNGAEFKPHSDIIRIIQSYGFIVASFFVYILWPRHRTELYILIPITICMLINTAINDYRIFGFYLLLLALLRSKKIDIRNQ